MTNQTLTETIRRNLGSVQQQIAAACERSGRPAASVKLVAVTKYADWDWVKTLAKFHSAFGENRPQQLAERSPLLPDAEWHLIGQLQRNKVRQALQHASVIHSVDSSKLLRRISLLAAELQVRPQILIQVNISGEDSKSGFTENELTAEWDSITQEQGHVDIIGLMTMAPASRELQEAQAVFRGLSRLKSELCSHPASVSSGITLSELSMGMSGDFEVAIEAGATIVRIGSRLYDGLQTQ